MHGVLFDGRWGGRPGQKRGVLGIARYANEVVARLPGVAVLESDFPLMHPAEQIWLWGALKRRDPRLYINPGFNGPCISPVPFIFTVHDLIHLRVHEATDRTKKLYYQFVVLPAARRARRVLTDSNYTHAQIVEWTGIAADKVVVVGMGAADTFTPEGWRYDAGSPYFLYVGNRKPHKNVGRLLEAYARSTASAEVRLLLAGVPDEETQRRIHRQRLGERVGFVEAGDDETLAALYRGATALVFPSLYEGFGIPALEAMASGTPVIASETTGLGEMVGNAALRVDPLDTEAIAAAMDRLADGASLRDELRRRGLERSGRYTWDRTAARIAEVIDAALEDD